MRHSADDLIKIVTDSFEAERTNDVEKGKSLITKDFKKISMVVHNDELFPAFFLKDKPGLIEKVYAVKGREFYVWNVAANENTQTVFIELAEVEPMSGRKQVWPYVLVCQIENGKIRRTRHYGDPNIIKKDVSVDMIQQVVES